METVERYYREKSITTLVNASNSKKAEGVSKILKGATRCATVGASVGLTIAGTLGGWAWLTVPLTIMCGPSQVRKGIKEMTTDAKAKFDEAKVLKEVAQDSNSFLKRDISKNVEPLKMANTSDVVIAPENKNETTNSYVN